MIIMISGKAGAGKGEVTECLLNKIPQSQELSIATPMKEIAIEYFGFKPWECYNSEREAFRSNYLIDIDNIPEEVSFGKTPESRAFLQNLGSFMKAWSGPGCEPNDSFWMDLLASYIRRDQEFGIERDAYIISDWRFPWERTYLLDKFPRSQKLLTIRVIREDLPEIEFGANHPTETSLTDNMEFYNKIIYNNGTLEDLQREVEEWVDTFLVITMREEKTGSYLA